jgi:hypothetical protein
VDPTASLHALVKRKIPSPCSQKININVFMSSVNLKNTALNKYVCVYLWLHSSERLSEGEILLYLTMSSIYFFFYSEVESFPCWMGPLSPWHGTARPQVLDGGKSSSLGVGLGANNPSP